MNEKALNYLGLMRKAGMLEIGETGAGAAVKAGKARLLLITPDAGDNARHRAESFTNGRSVLLVELPFGREEFSHHIGRENSVMAAVTDAGFAAAFMSLRYTPELVFEIDHSIEYGAHINDLINKLDIKHDDEE